MTFKWVSLSVFPWTWSVLNLEIKKRLNFNDFLWQATFEMLQIWAKYAILEGISPDISFFETFASNRPFITKALSNKIGKQFLKDWNECVNISRKMDKKIYKNLSFSQISKYFIIEHALRNSYRSCLVLSSELGILSLFPLS